MQAICGHIKLKALIYRAKKASNIFVKNFNCICKLERETKCSHLNGMHHHHSSKHF